MSIGGEMLLRRADRWDWLSIGGEMLIFWGRGDGLLKKTRTNV
jgi:hypothetical protein